MLSLQAIQKRNAILNGGGYCSYCEMLTEYFAHRFEHIEGWEEEEPAGLCKTCLDAGALENY